jgi:hypothetical protein
MYTTLLPTKQFDHILGGGSGTPGALIRRKVMCIQPSGDAGRVSDRDDIRRDVLRDDPTGSDDAVLSDGDTW